MPGRWISCNMGRIRGECAGVASGVYSGVGERESSEQVGEDGAVERGEFGRERLKRCSSSCECERDMDCENAYCEREGSRWLAAPPLWM